MSRRLLLLLPFLMLLGVLGHAQVDVSTPPATYSIQGFVRAGSGTEPLEKIRVDLRDPGGTHVASTLTHGDGAFEFDGLSDGEYTIDIESPHYEPVRQRVSLVGGSQRDVSVRLLPSVAPVDTSGATISAHQLGAPSKARDAFAKGMQLSYNKSDDRGAINEFERAIKYFPDYYEAYAQEGAAYYRLQDVDAAEKALRKSVNLSGGKYPDAMVALATLLNDTNRPDEAAKFARQAMDAESSSSWAAPLELARALNALKQPDEAEKYASESRDLKPDSPAVYLLLANIAIQRKDYRSLATSLDKYLKLFPDGPDADRARKMREQVSTVLNAPRKDSAEDAEGSGNSKTGTDAKPSSSAGTEADPKAPAHATQPAPTQDDSDLPSLPPPKDNDD